MRSPHPLAGVYAAAVTPLRPNFDNDPEAIPPLLAFLARRGCHGALLLGTTGEGTSFSPAERNEIFEAALEIRQDYPDFRLLAGTGTPSLTETIDLTISAFDAGFDGVVVLPPYFFRKVSDEGLFAWYSEVIHSAVPPGGYLLGYHIPPVTGIPLSLDLLARLKETYPDQFAGIKDSSADPEHARQLGERFGQDLFVLTGNDRLFTLALQNGASGCITAGANLFSPLLREIWEIYQQGQDAAAAQERLTVARDVLDRYPPAPALLKSLLSQLYEFPLWTVRPPLLQTPKELVKNALSLLETA